MAKRKHPSAPKRRKSSGDSGAAERWIYGVHAVEAALANPERIVRRLLATEEAAARLAEKSLGGPRPTIAGRGEIDRQLPPGAVHQGLALEAEPLPPADLEVVLSGIGPTAPALLVVLDQVTDPQNAGAVLRAAAAFGAAAVVVTDRNAPPASGALAKAAAGALETVPLVRVGNLVRAMEALKARDIWCLGLDGQAERSIAASDAGDRVALVLGAEGRGLRRLTRETCDLLVRIPIAPAMESLNVAAAAAVALYELGARRAGA